MTNCAATYQYYVMKHNLNIGEQNGVRANPILCCDEWVSLSLPNKHIWNCAMWNVVELWCAFQLELANQEWLKSTQTGPSSSNDNQPTVKLVYRFMPRLLSKGGYSLLIADNCGYVDYAPFGWGSTTSRSKLVPFFVFVFQHELMGSTCKTLRLYRHLFCAIGHTL